MADEATEFTAEDHDWLAAAHRAEADAEAAAWKAEHPDREPGEPFTC